MEKLRDALAAGEIDLAEAVERLGGVIRELDWRQLDELAGETPPKARDYLLRISSAPDERSGFSVPFQQDQALHVIQVEERQEPGPLPYDEVVERVKEDYLERFEQDLYRQVAESRFTAAGFVFYEEAARRLVTEPAAELSPES